ncbi:MAG: hypothetical protein LH631_08030 [Alkalinema sp. CAN_BIN05]|nr:hypothetical protein [Alkalinema sp. CAN_BIN05]
MSATSIQLQALEQTIVQLPDSDKLWLLNLLLDQLPNLPEDLTSRTDDLEDLGLYQAMLATKNEIPLTREAAIAEFDRP